MKGPLSLIIFLFLAIIAWWSITEKHEEEQLQQAKSKSYVEIFMNEFEITTMNENGSPNYILNGSYLQRYNDSDETEVQKPVFNLLQKNGQWKISADNAIINNKNETIQLNNNVIMQQQNIEPAITIRTQRLLINTKT
jgi:LPS export ABC transporter protein LptC